MVTAFLSSIHEILRRNSETKSLVRLLIKKKGVKTKFSCTHSVWMKAQLAFSVALTANITDQNRVRFFLEVERSLFKRKTTNKHLTSNGLLKCCGGEDNCNSELVTDHPM